VACDTNRTGTKAYRAKRWIGFSEDDAERIAGGAKYQAAKPFSQRVEDNAFHRCAQEIRFRFCYQMLTEYSSTTLLFWIRETRPCGDWGFQIRDLQVAFRFTAPNFTTSTTQ
jgi:hypothetical protein